MPRQPSKSNVWIRYNNFCSICWLEHCSPRELTEHCLSKEHAANYYKLEIRNPERFAKLAKWDCAFECYICTALGKYSRFSLQEELKVRLYILYI